MSGMSDTLDITGRRDTLTSAALCALALLVSVAFWCCMSWAQTAESKTSDANQSWTTSHDSRTDVDSIHAVESHNKTGNRTVDRRTTERRQPDGSVSGYQEVETESVQVNPSTIRTITRTFARDAGGGKMLVQQDEEETQNLPGGGSKSVRSTSRPDVSGNIQLAQREISETKKLGRDVEITNTTLMLPSVNGGLAPASQTEERRQQAGNNTEFQNTTRTLDGGGH